MADIFHFDGDKPSFEDLGVPNGTRKWREIDLENALGYQGRKSFREAVRRAQQACLAIKIPIEDHFVLDGSDYKFTRFACYLISINGDPKKPEIAAAQAYFATIAETFQSQFEHLDGVDRVLVRDDLSVGMKTLASTAQQHGVEQFAFFANEGYRGMYNMSLAELGRHKGLGAKEKLLDRMGRQEMAGNLFRVTETEAKIRHEGITGQRLLEHAAHEVGRTVRATMIKLSGTTPENLPLAAPIQEVKKKIKGASRRFGELDRAPKPKKPKALGNAKPVLDTHVATPDRDGSSTDE